MGIFDKLGKEIKKAVLSKEKQPPSLEQEWRAEIKRCGSELIQGSWDQAMAEPLPLLPGSLKIFPLFEIASRYLHKRALFSLHQQVLKKIDFSRIRDFLGSIWISRAILSGYTREDFTGEEREASTPVMIGVLYELLLELPSSQKAWRAFSKTYQTRESTFDEFVNAKTEEYTQRHHSNNHLHPIFNCEECHPMREIRLMELYLFSEQRIQHLLSSQSVPRFRQACLGLMKDILLSPELHLRARYHFAAQLVLAYGPQEFFHGEETAAIREKIMNEHNFGHCLVVDLAKERKLWEAARIIEACLDTPFEFHFLVGEASDLVVKATEQQSVPIPRTTPAENTPYRGGVRIVDENDPEYWRRLRVKLHERDLKRMKDLNDVSSVEDSYQILTAREEARVAFLLEDTNEAATHLSSAQRIYDAAKTPRTTASDAWHAFYEERVTRLQWEIEKARVQIALRKASRGEFDLSYHPPDLSHDDHPQDALEQKFETGCLLRKLAKTLEKGGKK